MFTCWSHSVKHKTNSLRFAVALLLIYSKLLCWIEWRLLWCWQQNCFYLSSLHFLLFSCHFSCLDFNPKIFSPGAIIMLLVTLLLLSNEWSLKVLLQVMGKVQQMNAKYVKCNWLSLQFHLINLKLDFFFSTSAPFLLKKGPLNM